MKTLLLVSLVAGICSCSTVQSKAPVKPAPESSLKKIKARITYYYPEKPFWKKVSDPKIKVATEGVTVAAHPDFPFGTKVFIPELKNKLDDGTFVVQDRGSAVTSKKAAKGTAYVFDVYVSNSRKMRFYEKNVDMWSDVYIMN